MTHDPEEMSRTVADICDLHGQGFSLAKVCAREGMPSLATVYRWISETPAIAAMLQCARHEYAARLADEILKIADAAADKDAAAVAKLQIDTRKWVVETLLLDGVKKAADSAPPAPIAVTINTDADATRPVSESQISL